MNLDAVLKQAHTDKVALAVVRSQRNAAIDSVEHFQTQANILAEDLKTVRERVVELEASLASSNAALKSAQDRVQALQREIASKDSQIEARAEDYRNLKKELELLKEEDPKPATKKPKVPGSKPENKPKYVERTSDSAK